MAREAAWLTADKQGLAAVLLQSHQRAFSRPLIASAQPGQPKRMLCQNLFACGFPVLAHGTEQDPALSYANAAALQLWDSHWDGLIGMPSRLTAPDSERAERSSALGQAKRLDAVQNYHGIRISRKGRRFMINKARIWTLWDAEEQICGQAACFSDWWWL
ncbi:MEKHLA domain-containing protein [Synechococcus sp. N5]|uniref:MEKHLA domain-containing protein n=1 Tax=Synechococcus sp. N5 TaxID=2575515 RepID=UPI000E0F3E2E|nr:MEKHLA domain-containing protein [Synechococcus sp. N5]